MCVHPQVLHRLHCWQQGSDSVTAGEGRSQPGAVMIGVTIPFCPQLWGLLGQGLMNSLLRVPLSAWALLSTHCPHLTAETINMPPGWHLNRSWPHRKENLGQVSLLVWTRGQAEGCEGRGKLGDFAEHEASSSEQPVPVSKRAAPAAVSTWPRLAKKI